MQHKLISRKKIVHVWKDAEYGIPQKVNYPQRGLLRLGAGQGRVFATESRDGNKGAIWDAKAFITIDAMSLEQDKCKCVRYHKSPYFFRKKTILPSFL